MLRFKLKDLMQSRGVSYKQVSEGAGVSTQTIYRLIKETPKMVGTEVIARLCLYFECEPNDLMAVQEKEQ